MIKHCIKFNDGKTIIALDRQEIVSFHAALEPFVVGSMLGVNDVDMRNFVKEYMEDIEEKRAEIKKGGNIKPHKMQSVDKKEQLPKHDEDNIRNLADYRAKDVDRQTSNS